MMRWKPVVGLVLLVAAVVGGVTLYIRYQIKTALEDAIAELSPFAEMQYASVSVTLGGNVHIRDIEIRPRMVNDPLHIEGIEVETPGLWFLLTGAKKLSDGELPEHLRATLRGLAFNLSGPLAETFDVVMAEAMRSNGAAPLSNCGDVRYVDFNTYQRLGYQSLVFDVSLGYRFEKGGGLLRVTTEWRMRDLGVATVNLEFVGASLNLRQVMGTQPFLRAFDVVYQDLSFIDRVKRYCTQASGMTVEQYIESEVNRNAAAYKAQLGFVPGPGLRQAHREFLTRPGEVRLQGTPSVELDMQTLRLFKPEDIVSMLNLRVSVNGKAVTDLSMISVPSTPTRAALPPTAGPASVTSEFRAVPTTDLAGHIGKTVRLHLTHGATREGRLVQVLDGMARVERRFPGGAMTLAISLREIERVEVLL
ncbi:MAG: hypothetical protein HYV92_06515 [Candidatus Rokubacteria bacterium]|nr:hypothetical protein [Candidatus Rokubacteria bacterium]